MRPGIRTRSNLKIDGRMVYLWQAVDAEGEKGAADYIPDNGIVERCHKTMLNEFYRIAFRKKI